MKTIMVDQIIDSSIAVSPAKGELLCSEIIDNIERKENICINFMHIEQLTTAFLNNAIGILYKKYTSEELNKYLKVEGLDDLDKFLFAKVISRAKMDIVDNEDLNHELKGDY